MGKSDGRILRVTESADGRREVRVTRSYLEQLVREEMSAALREADEEDPDVVDNSAKPPDVKGKKAPPQDVPVDKGQERFASPPDAGGEEVPDVEDPADDELEAEVDPEVDPEDTKLSDELVGKTIQSVTMEPKSKLVAGAQELVLTFNESSDPLRVIITKSGQVRFMYRGALHNMI